MGGSLKREVVDLETYAWVPQLLLLFPFSLLSPFQVGTCRCVNQPKHSHLLSWPLDSTGIQEGRLMIW